MDGVRYSHDDQLVIMPLICNSQVKRVLIVIGVLVDVMLFEAFINMGYYKSQLPHVLFSYMDLMEGSQK